MPIDVLMPALSPTMEEGTLAKWCVREGDRVASGDVLAEIETDKAVMEIEAAEEGMVMKLLVPEGAQAVKVNTPIAILLEEGVDPTSVACAQPTSYALAPESITTSPMFSSFSSPSFASSVREAAVPHATASSSGEAEFPPGTLFEKQTVREALCAAMAEEMRRDPDVFVLGEEVAEYQGAYKITQGLLQEFGAKRVVDTPITEHGFTGLAVGAALAGLRPIVEFMTFNFAMQAMDQIINSAAKTLYMSGGQLGCPIVLRGPNGAAARVAAQHSQDYAAWYSHIPGLRVIQPWSAADAKGLLKAAIRDPNPVIFLENEILYGRSFDVPILEDHVTPIGKAKIIRSGQDVTLVSFGIGMEYATKAAEILQELEIEAEIVDLRSLRPLDMETVLTSVRKTNRCVTVEEGWPQCSISSEIGFRIMQEAFDFLDAPVLRVTGKDVPMPYAANLEKLALPSVAEVVEAAKAVTYWS